MCNETGADLAPILDASAGLHLAKGILLNSESNIYIHTKIRCLNFIFSIQHGNKNTSLRNARNQTLQYSQENPEELREPLAVGS